MGWVVALLTAEAVSAQTASKLVRVLDRRVAAFHQARLDDGWAYLLLDGVWMKVRRAWGPQRVLLVAYGIRRNGERQLLGFVRAPGESQATRPASPTTGTYFSAQYHRLAARRGRKRAIIAVAHALLSVVYSMLK